MVSTDWVSGAPGAWVSELRLPGERNGILQGREVLSGGVILFKAGTEFKDPFQELPCL